MLLIDVLALSTTSLAGSGEELGMDPQIGQPTCWRLCREPFFSGAVTLSNSVNDSRKVATYRNCPQEAYARRTWTGVGSIYVMLVGFSTVGCTSIRIAVTLGYE
jgi:hypothetical protein